MKLTKQYTTNYSIRTCNLNKKVNTKHRISYLTGTCYNFELEEFLAWFRVARVCQRQLGILVSQLSGV